MSNLILKMFNRSSLRKRHTFTYYRRLILVADQMLQEVLFGPQALCLNCLQTDIQLEPILLVDQQMRLVVVVMIPIASAGLQENSNGQRRSRSSNICRWCRWSKEGISSGNAGLLDVSTTYCCLINCGRPFKLFEHC